MSKMQARIAGKLIAISVSFGVYSITVMSMTNNAHAKGHTEMSVLMGRTLGQREPWVLN